MHPRFYVSPGFKIVLQSLVLSGLIAAFFGVSGCDQGRLTAVSLSTRPLQRREPHELEVRAQVATSQSDLSYKWFADYGECDPQESATPTTTFRFAEAAKQDVITVEVWRAQKRLGQTRTQVRDTEHVPAGPHPQVSIQILEIPPAESGGPATRASISGTVTGEIAADFKVVIYVRDSGVWWIQPATRALHSIQSDHTWSTWTHTGRVYAAFVVRSDYVPLRTYDVLPAARGEILARVIVDGKNRAP